MDDNVGYHNVTLDDLKRARWELKAWEINIKTMHGRAPTQDDILKDEVMGKPSVLL